MRYGLTFFPTARSIHPSELAVAAEQRGFESVWFAEHSHIPISPATPGPPEPGQPGLPAAYYAVADPFVALSMAAAATKVLRVATGICLVPQRDVFQTAKQVASLDVFSQGRVLLGVGAGWNQPEIENHGVRFAKRFAIMREKIEAMKGMWSDEEKFEYHGDHVDFDPVYSWPKPHQRPHPPVHVGGAGLRAIDRAVRYGDGWVPLYGDGADDPIDLIPQLQERLSAAERDRAGFEMSIYFCPPESGAVDRCLAAGIDRVLFPVPSDARDDVLAKLDEFSEFIGGQ